jgi:hypothetical protein
LIESPRLRANRTRSQTPALLRGLIFGSDGRAMSPTHTRGRRGQQYRYYVSQSVLKGGAADGPAVSRLPAEQIEAAVVDQLRALLRQPEVVVGTWQAARAHGSDSSEAEAREALERLDPLWDELFPAERARIVRLALESWAAWRGTLRCRPPNRRGPQHDRRRADADRPCAAWRSGSRGAGGT